MQSSGLRCDGGDVGIGLIDRLQIPRRVSWFENLFCFKPGQRVKEVTEPGDRGRVEKQINVAMAFIKKIFLFVQ